MVLWAWKRFPDGSLLKKSTPRKLAVYRKRRPLRRYHNQLFTPQGHLYGSLAFTFNLGRAETRAYPDYAKQ
jgi:hypothetical protein